MENNHNRASSIGGDDGKIELNLSSECSDDKNKFQKNSEDSSNDLDLILKINHIDEDLNDFQRTQILNHIDINMDVDTNQES